MDDKLTVGFAAFPAQGANGQINLKDTQIKLKEDQILKDWDLLANAISRIDKRLENIEKLLLEIQQSQDKTGEKETAESRD